MKPESEFTVKPFKGSYGLFEGEQQFPSVLGSKSVLEKHKNTIKIDEELMEKNGNDRVFLH